MDAFQHSFWGTRDAVWDAWRASKVIYLSPKSILKFRTPSSTHFGNPGCRVGCLEGRWKTGFWKSRRSFWMSREFILDSSKVCFEFARVIFASYNRFGALVSAFRVSSEYFFHLDSFWRQRTCFCAHETDSELQLLRCLFPKLRLLSDPACQRSSDRGPACH